MEQKTWQNSSENVWKAWSFCFFFCNSHFLCSFYRGSSGISFEQIQMAFVFLSRDTSKI